jgi:hypothetical protein
MDGLDIDRDGENVNSLTAEGRKKMEEAAKMQAMNGGFDSELYSNEDVATVTDDSMK